MLSIAPDMVRAAQKEKKLSHRGMLAKRLVCAFAASNGLFAAQFTLAQEDTAAWRELQAVESLLGTDPVAAVPRAEALRASTTDETDQLLRARVFLVECGAHYRAGDNSLAAVACDDANAIAEQLGDSALLVEYSTGAPLLPTPPVATRRLSSTMRGPPSMRS